MRLTQVIDDAASSAGYKFDLFDAESKTVVKVFATRDAVVEAIAVAAPGGTFEAALVEAANAKFERQELEEDGLILIEKGNVTTSI